MQVFLSFLTGLLSFHSFIYFPFTTLAAILLAGTAVAVSLRLRPFLLCIVLCAVAGWWYAWIRYTPPQTVEAPPLHYLAKGTFTSLPVRKEHGWYQELKLSQVTPLPEEETPCPETGNPVPPDFVPPASYLVLPARVFTSTPFAPGTAIHAKASLKSSSPLNNPGGFDSTGSYLQGSIKEVHQVTQPRGLAGFFQTIQYRLHKGFESAYQGNVSGLLEAITIGYMGGLDVSAMENFRKTGLSHLLSVSGTHFALLYVLVFALFLAGARWFIPYPWLHRITGYVTVKQLCACLTMPFLVAYLLLSGMSVPAVRSFLMISLVLTAMLAGRRVSLPNSLAFAAVVIALMDPASLFTISFLLSFSAILFIGLAVLEYTRACDRQAAAGGPAKRPSYLVGSALTSLAATMGTLPIVLYKFHVISLSSVLINFIAIPFMCFIILPLALVYAGFYLWWGYFPFAGVLGGLTEVFLFFTERAALLPYGSFTVPAFPFALAVFFYGTLLSFFLFKQKRIALLLLAVTIIWTTGYGLSAGRHGLKVVFLNVGQGDGAVIQTGTGKAIVMDTGQSGKEVASYLRYLGKSSIDAVVLSHRGRDHAGGLDYLTHLFTIENIWETGLDFPLSRKESAPAAPSLHYLARGDEILVDGVVLTVLNPSSSQAVGRLLRRGNRSNNNSLVVKLTARKTAFLFTGDIEAEAEKDMAPLREHLMADVLKVAHHGSATSTTDGFLQHVRPSYAVISAGKWNHFCHPDERVLKRLDKTMSFRTDRDGAILFEETAQGVMVKKYADFTLQPASGLERELKNLALLFHVW